MLCAAMAMLPAGAAAADADSVSRYIPEVHATLRTRYEVATESGEARFQVRNARVNMNGDVTDFLGYFLRADFCDRGSFKMLDAYAIFHPSQTVQVMLGQMRVPLSVDATRSVNAYWFANRSLPSRDMWSSRKVGVKGRYSFSVGAAPAYVEGGVFSSASTSEQTSWSKSYTFGIVGVVTTGDFTPEIGFQSNELGNVRVNNWDASLTWCHGEWEAEAEFLYKVYTNRAAKAVKAFNIMGRRFFPVKSRYVNRLSVEARYDGATDNCDGALDDDGRLCVTQTSRRRLTAGATAMWLKGPVKAHVRLNYEQYFHDGGHVASPADGNKLCVELMVHF